MGRSGDQWMQERVIRENSVEFGGLTKCFIVSFDLPWFLNQPLHQNPLVGLLKPRLLGPTTEFLVQ